MRTREKKGILFSIMEQENKKAKPRSRLKVLLVFALILTAIIFGVVQIVAWRTRIKDRRELVVTIQTIKESLGQQRIYALNADPDCSQVTVTISNNSQVLASKNNPIAMFFTGKSSPIGLIFINLPSRKCRVPLLKVLGKRYDYDESKAAPSGHSLVTVLNSQSISNLKYWYSYLCKTYLKKNFSLNDRHLYFYDADSDKLRSLPKPANTTSLSLVGHPPGKNQIVVLKTDANTNPQSYSAYVLDENGRIIKTYKYKPCPYYPYAGHVGLYKQHVGHYSDKYYRWLTRDVSLKPWDNGPTRKIKVPEKQFILGYSPGLKYALFAPANKSLWRNCPMLMTPHKSFIRTLINPIKSFRKGKAGENKSAFPAPSYESLPVTLWDCEKKKGIRLFSISVPQTQTGNNNDYSYSLAVTKTGVLVTHSQPSDNKGPRQEARYYNFKSGKWTNLNCIFRKPVFHWIIHQFSSDESEVLINLQMEVKDGGTRGFSVSNSLILVNLSSGTPRDLPPKFSPGTTIMKDGRILGVLGDDLVYYDPATKKSEIIVKNLFETWKRLVDAKLRSR